MKNGPLVSVLTTAYNREQFIAESIESVLASTYTNFELIIVDDGSTDNTVSIARDFEKKDKRIKVYVNDTNLGDYNNRNKAASYATGKYLKYVDSDDQIYYHTLDVMVSFMECFPDAGFGLCGPQTNKPLPIQLLPKQIYLTNFNGYGHFSRGPLSSIIKNEAFNKVGGFSGERFYGDMELWLKLSCYYSLVMLPGDLTFYRIHDESEAKAEALNSRNVNKRREELILQYLHHEDCPLDQEDVSMIKKYIKRTKLKNKVLNSLGIMKRLIRI